MKIRDISNRRRNPFRRHRARDAVTEVKFLGFPPVWIRLRMDDAATGQHGERSDQFTDDSVSKSCAYPRPDFIPHSFSSCKTGFAAASKATRMPIQEPLLIKLTKHWSVLLRAVAGLLQL
jgi:hypothetical protein